MSGYILFYKGSFLFAVSLANSNVTNWTSWISFAVCGVLQGVLVTLYFLIMLFGYRNLDEENDPLIVAESSQPFLDQDLSVE